MSCRFHTRDVYRKSLPSFFILLIIACITQLCFANYYTKAPAPIVGTITLIGSDSMEPIFTALSQEFNKLYPNIQFTLSAKGSAAGALALAENRSNLALMSRIMKAEENELFFKKHGYEPTPIRIAIDAVVLYANKDNPITGLTMAQVDAIFSNTRNCGANNQITKWSELLHDNKEYDAPIVAAGRTSTSGTRDVFQKRALCQGNFTPKIAEYIKTQDLLKYIAQEPFAIGYASLNSKSKDVKIIPITRKFNSAFVYPNNDTITHGKYPLSRYLYLYVNKAPNTPFNPVDAEFIKFILSADGQNIIKQLGYVSLGANAAELEIQKIG